MIVPSILILVTILLSANVASFAYRKLHPPCDDLQDYFNSVKKMVQPMNSLSSLTILRKKPVKSIETVEEDKESIKVVSEKSVESFKKSLEKIFPTTRDSSTSNDTKKTSNNYQGTNNAMFEEEMEGIGANNSHRNVERKKIQTSGVIGRTLSNGYVSR